MNSSPTERGSVASLHPNSGPSELAVQVTAGEQLVGTRAGGAAARSGRSSSRPRLTWFARLRQRRQFPPRKRYESLRLRARRRSVCLSLVREAGGESRAECRGGFASVSGPVASLLPAGQPSAHPLAGPRFRRGTSRRDGGAIGVDFRRSGCLMLGEEGASGISQPLVARSLLRVARATEAKHARQWPTGLGSARYWGARHKEPRLLDMILSAIVPVFLRHRARLLRGLDAQDRQSPRCGELNALVMDFALRRRCSSRCSDTPSSAACSGALSSSSSRCRCW